MYLTVLVELITYGGIIGSLSEEQLKNAQCWIVSVHLFTHNSEEDQSLDSDHSFNLLFWLKLSVFLVQFSIFFFLLPFSLCLYREVGARVHLRVFILTCFFCSLPGPREANFFPFWRVSTGGEKCHTENFVRNRF